ncbi:MAG TPA: hypothetical protein VK210_11370, partial [Terriglobia bacterium]|nr:hypothetical protein [Terriglobia bacterium]
MVPIKLRDGAGLLIAATLSAILYHYWLISPVLEYVSFNEWRAVAVLVTLAVGGVWPFFKWNVSTLVVGYVAGILVSGTELAWRLQDVLPTSIGSAFQSHLEYFGPDVIMLTIAVMLGGYCSTRI